MFTCFVFYTCLVLSSCAIVSSICFIVRLIKDYKVILNYNKIYGEYILSDATTNKVISIKEYKILSFLNSKRGD